MALVLRLGTESTATLEVPPEALLAVCAAPRGQVISDVAAAVDRALAEPLDFPPLAQSVVPGDKVVLALAAGVPHAATIVARLLAALSAPGIDAADITLVCAPDDDASDWLAAIPRELRQSMQLETHDPARREALSYLAADAAGKAIYINRTLHEADAVISIGSLRLDEATGHAGMHSSVFPAFSDAARLQRYRTLSAFEPPQQQKLRKQADEVGWLLGLQFTIQVVPGAGNSILHVLAGGSEAVYRAGCQMCEAAWDFEVSRLADVVVATIEGDAAQQTWQHLGYAASAATRVVKPGGAIVICSELEQGLGPALEQLVGAPDLDEALAEIQRQHPVDALTAARLVQALSQGKVYLISRLHEELVEELGMAPLNASQLSRIVGRYASCIVLTNAQYAVAHLPADETAAPVFKRKLRS